jgi:hypothetical protein
MNSSLSFALFVAIAATTITGCVSVHRVTIKDAPRNKVRFESAKATRIFYDALLAKHLPSSGKQSGVVLGQTVYRPETRPSPNVAFNDGVVVADSDADGVVSEREARQYASTITK